MSGTVEGSSSLKGIAEPHTNRTTGELRDLAYEKERKRAIYRREKFGTDKKQNDLGSGQFLTSKWCMTRSSLTRPVPLTENSRPIFEQNENEEKTLRLYWCFFFIV